MHTTIQPGWAAEGEDRVGYATIARLVECVRELHWRLDVLPVTRGDTLDTITRRIEVDFWSPLLVGADVVGRYGVESIRPRSYQLTVSIASDSTGEPLMGAILTNVFYDPLLRSAIPCPPGVKRALLNR
jgi:acyl-CoA thioesterase FadM